MKWPTTTTSLSFHCAHTGLGSDDLSICELCTPPSASFLEAATAQSLGTSHCTCHHFLPKNGGSSWISTFSLGFSNVSTVFSSVLDPVSKTSRYLRLGGMAGVSFFWPMAKMMISTEKTTRPFKGRCHFLFETAEMLVFRLCKTFIQW